MPQEITKRELLDRMSWKKGSRQKKEITKRGLLNRMSWKKGGWQNKAMMLRAPEPPPENCALPPEHIHAKGW